MDLIDFVDLEETWGTRIMLTSGKWKGHVLDFKVVAERVAFKGETDKMGLPKFNVSLHPVIRVLPPTKPEKSK